MSEAANGATLERGRVHDSVPLDVGDKRRKLLYVLLATLPVASFAWLGYCSRFDNRVPSSLATLVMWVGCYSGFRLAERHRVTASWIYVLTLVLASLIVDLTHPGLLRLEFGVFIVIVANALLGHVSSFAAATIACAGRLWTLGLPADGLGSPPSPGGLIALFLFVWCAVALADVPLNELASSALVAWEHARQALDEARDRRAELARVVRALEEATFRIERTNNELLLARWDAEAVRDSKAQFAANVSHEIRGPLNLILGFSRMMALYPEKYECALPTAYHADLDTIYRNSEHLASLVDDVLDLSQIEAQRFSLAEEHVDLGQEVIAEVIDSVRPLAARKGLYLRSAVVGDLTPVVADGARMRQALLNLTLNAVRFTECGGITVCAARQDESVLISVKDTGVGIPSEDLPRLFEEFSQVHSTRTREASGTGLGLSISKRLVELHGGRIWVESEQGVGTTFHLSIPAESDRVPSQPQTTRPSTRAQRPLRDVCLVVHDDVHLIRALGRHLRQCRVVGRGEGDHVLALVEELHPKAVITSSSRADQMLDEMSHKTYDVPIISFDVASRASGKDLGGVLAYLMKPVIPEMLAAIVSRIPQRGELTVLLVDDDPDALRLLEDMLTLVARPLTILRAYDGVQAMELMANAVPDLVFLDLIMPQENGEETLRRMRASERLADVPVVIVSAKDTVDGDDLAVLGPIRLLSLRSLSMDATLQCVEAMLSAATPRYVP